MKATTTDFLSNDLACPCPPLECVAGDLIVIKTLLITLLDLTKRCGIMLASRKSDEAITADVKHFIIRNAKGRDSIPLRTSASEAEAG